MPRVPAGPGLSERAAGSKKFFFDFLPFPLAKASESV